MSSISSPEGELPEFTSRCQAALFWLSFGLHVIPLLPGKEIPAIEPDPWLNGLCDEKVAGYFALHPDHDVGAIVGTRVVVMDTDGTESIEALRNIQKEHWIRPMLTVLTSNGRQEYFSVPEGVCVKLNSCATKDHPARINVKTGRGVIALPPSGDRSVWRKYAATASDLEVVSQEFIDAIFAHNRQPAPRPTEPPTPERNLHLPTGEALGHLQVESGTTKVASPSREPHPFDRYALNEHLEDLEARTEAQVPLLGELVASGEATIIYAAPNTGKTLLTFRLIQDAVSAGRLDPSKVYFINLDDSGPGLLEKVRLAKACGIKMLTDGEQGFEAHHLPRLLSECIKSNRTDVLVVVDTIKKVANLMDKGDTSNFTQTVRRFCKKGGTFLGMAHVNKNLGPDGMPIYAGVSDSRDDFDCAHVLWTVPGKPGANESVVIVKNEKRRFPVARKAAYAYSVDDEFSYEQRLKSVRQLDGETLEALQYAGDKISDQRVIAAARETIGEGPCNKMGLAKEIMSRTGISRTNAIRVIEKYTGSDPAVHLWNLVVGPHNAKIYYLLQPSPSAGTVPATT